MRIIRGSCRGEKMFESFCKQGIEKGALDANLAAIRNIFKIGDKWFGTGFLFENPVPNQISG